MKHPHCNRSRFAHYFWCRGFAPVVFIVAVALIVIAVGTGVYFSLYKKAQAPTPQDIVQATSSDLSEGATTTDLVVITATTTQTATSSVTPGKTAGSGATQLPSVPTAHAPTTALNTMYLCGSDTKTANACLAQHIKTCSPAKGTVVDSTSGLTLERIIDGYKGSNCSYRTTIVSGQGEYALLAGMNVNCLLPKTMLTALGQGTVMTSKEMLSFCTGTFIDLMREQLGSSGQ